MLINNLFSIDRKTYRRQKIHIVGTRQFFADQPNRLAKYLFTIFPVANAFADEGVDCIFPLPDQQQKLLKFIYDVKAGIYPRDINEFTDILDSMLERGAHYFVLGCTELPLISEYFGLDKKYELLDSTLEQARAAVLACGYELKGSVSYDEE